MNIPVDKGNRCYGSLFLAMLLYRWQLENGGCWGMYGNER